jgi:hypothetical protein
MWSTHCCGMVRHVGHSEEGWRAARPSWRLNMTARQWRVGDSNSDVQKRRPSGVVGGLSLSRCVRARSSNGCMWSCSRSTARAPCQRMSSEIISFYVARQVSRTLVQRLHRKRRLRRASTPWVDLQLAHHEAVLCLDALHLFWVCRAARDAGSLGSNVFSRQ